MRFRGSALAAALTLVIGTVWGVMASFRGRRQRLTTANPNPGSQTTEHQREDKPRSEILVPALVSLITTLLANVGVVSSLAFGFWPGLKPETPPPDLSAKISNLEIENTNVGFADYLLDEQLNLPATGESADQLQEYLGHVVSFDMDLKGMESDPVVVKWTMYNAQTRELFPPFFGLTSQIAFDSIIPRSESTHVRVRIWVPIPNTPPVPVGFRVDVYDKEGGGRLASYKTDKLTLTPVLSS